MCQKVSNPPPPPTTSANTFYPSSSWYQTFSTARETNLLTPLQVGLLLSLQKEQYWWWSTNIVDIRHPHTSSCLSHLPYWLFLGTFISPKKLPNSQKKNEFQLASQQEDSKIFSLDSGWRKCDQWQQMLRVPPPLNLPTFVNYLVTVFQWQTPAWAEGHSYLKGDGLYSCRKKDIQCTDISRTRQNNYYQDSSYCVTKQNLVSLPVPLTVKFLISAFLLRQTSSLETNKIAE